MTQNTIIVGTRASPLALTQTQMVISQLQAKFQDLTFEIKTITTTGDEVSSMPLNKIGQKGLFTKELEVALLNGTVDFVVHSLKDLATTLPDGLMLASVLEREDPRDVLILREGHHIESLDDLPDGACIGTSSVRRLAQLKHLKPQLQFKDVRGNINTRLRKLDEGLYDGLVLAYAGVTRMNWQHRISLVLDDMLYAVGQGALAIETRSDDQRTIQLVQSLQHSDTLFQVTAERQVMKLLEGGCSVPIGVQSQKNGISAVVCSVDGSNRIEASHSLVVKSLHDAELLGRMVAEMLAIQGAHQILRPNKD